MQVDVDIGSMVDPRTFWVKKLLPTGMKNDIYRKVTVIEDLLEKTMKTEFSKPDRYISADTIPGTRVAVRRSVSTNKWVRGRLEEIVVYDKLLVGRVFLLDSGEMLERVNILSCVRKLPSFMIREKPLAVQIVLRGLHPVTVDLDFQRGDSLMSLVRGASLASWTEASVRYMEQLLGRTRLRGELRDCVEDKQNRLHGQLYLVVDETEEFIHINNELVKKQFAIECEKTHQDDMVAIPPVIVTEESSIEDSDEDLNEEELRSLGQDRRTNRDASPDIDIEWFERNRLERSSADISLISNSLRPSREKRKKKRSRLVACPRDGSCTTSRGRGSSSVSGNKTAVVGRAAKLGQVLAEKEKNRDVKPGGGGGRRPTQSTVEKIRQSLIAKDEEEDAGDVWSDLRKGAPERDSSAVYALPGGVFKGKFHEALLANFQSTGLSGPKTPQILSQFIAETGWTPSPIIRQPSATDILGVKLEEQLNSIKFD